jgi:Sec-independent protein secretion pathway component TatC
MELPSTEMKAYKSSELALVADFVDVVVEQLIDEVDMGEEHPAATVAIEAQLIEYLSNIHVFPRVAVLISIPHHFAELVPFVSDHLTAAEASHWNYHLLIKLLSFELQLLNMPHR